MRLEVIKGGNELTKPFYCHGCKCFEVLIRHRIHGDKIKYWCAKSQGHIDAENMTEGKCPLKKWPSARWDGWRGKWTR